MAKNINKRSKSSVRERLAQFFSSCKSLITSSKKETKKTVQYHSNENIHAPNLSHMPARSASVDNLRTPNQSKWQKPFVSDNGNYRI